MAAEDRNGDFKRAMVVRHVVAAEDRNNYQLNTDPVDVAGGGRRLWRPRIATATSSGRWLSGTWWRPRIATIISSTLTRWMWLVAAVAYGGRGSQRRLQAGDGCPARGGGRGSQQLSAQH